MSKRWRQSGEILKENEQTDGKSAERKSIIRIDTFLRRKRN